MSLQAADKDYYNLLALTYGENASLFKGFTDWTKSLNHLGKLFDTTTTMEVRLPENKGTIDENPLEVDLPMIGFIDTLTNGEPHSPVFVTLTEKSTSTAAILETTEQFVGKLIQSRRNPEGKTGMATLEFVSWKSLMDISMGKTSDHECDNSFGDLGCKIAVAPLKQPGLLATVIGTTVTITGLPVLVNASYRRGFIEYLGLRLAIREFILPDTFLLVKQPPSPWLGATVIVTPGCDLSEATCNIYLNQSNFAGVGMKTPRYNPVIESA